MEANRHNRYLPAGCVLDVPMSDATARDWTGLHNGSILGSGGCSGGVRAFDAGDANRFETSAGMGLGSDFTLLLYHFLHEDTEGMMVGGIRDGSGNSVLEIPTRPVPGVDTLILANNQPQIAAGFHTTADHIAFVVRWAGSQTLCDIYRNGSWEDVATSDEGPFSATEKLYLGYSFGTINAQCIASRIQMFNRVLTATEIKALADQGPF